MKKNQAYIICRFSSILIKVTFFLIAVLVLNGCQIEDDDFSGITGSKAPAFRLTSSDGNQVNLFDFNKKVVVLFFLGTDSSCKAVVPDIETMLVTPFANRTDFIILGLDYFNGDMTSVKAFKTAAGLSFPLLLNGGNVATNYNTTYNRIVIIDQELNIVFSGTKCASEDISTVKQKLDLLFAK